MKRLTKAQWNAVGVLNPHELGKLGGGRVFISYRPWGEGRSCIVAGWMVHGIGFDVDPEAHWMEYGSKWFSVSGGRDKGLNEAKDWAAKKYGINSWVRDPFGAWHDVAAFERAMAQAVKP